MKTIVVPKDKIAEEALDYDNADQEQLFEVFLDEAEFKDLWENDFFIAINVIAGSNIDDYEDEKIVELEVLRRVIKSELFLGENYQANIRSKITDIRILFEEAEKRGTGVYFYF